MPRPRYQNLSEEKQRRLIDAAAAEIAERGLQEASLNRILERAGFSKGVAYYYFEDRDDLLATVLRHRLRASIADLKLDVDGLSASSFWDELLGFVEGVADPRRFDPWLLTVARAIWGLPPERRSRGAIGELWADMSGALRAVIRRGRALGVVRDDLPEDLLVAAAMAVGEACDRWVLDHVEGITPDDLKRLGERCFDLFRRMLEADAPRRPVQRRRK
jgi:AcrR family transcriptional regulator